MDFWLSLPQRERLSEWDSSKTEDNRSLTHSVLSPLWRMLARLVPKTVSPNVLSLCGMLFLIQAKYVCTDHMKTQPRNATCIAAIVDRNASNAG